MESDRPLDVDKPLKPSTKTLKNEKTSENKRETQGKYLLCASALSLSLGLGLGLSFRFTKIKQANISSNSILFGLKALGIGTLICFGTFGLGIVMVSKTLKVKNIDEFSNVMRNYAKISFPSLKVSSHEIDHDDTDTQTIFKNSRHD